jgi:hypothetical protein
MAAIGPLRRFDDKAEPHRTRVMDQPLNPGKAASSRSNVPGTQAPGRRFLLVAVLVTGAVLTLVGLFAASVSGEHMATFSVMVLMVAASFAVGGLIGFLFGIPRSLQEHAVTVPAATGMANEQPSYAVNTNLEQISDWLTKILVGIGLVEVARAPSAVGRLIDTLATSLGGHPIDKVMTGTVVIFFPIVGFLVSYLLTRLLLRRAFTQADLSAIGLVAAQAARSQVRQQEQIDADTFSLVATQLDPPPGTSPPGQQRLDAALTQASSALRSQVFSLARDRRAAHYVDPDRATMMRTIPVFHALIAADPESHRNHGQLGYALKDSEPADLDGAERELDLAIALRNRQGGRGWLYYELNRAALRVTRDLAKMAADEPTDPDTRSAILGDLQAAAANEHLRGIIWEDAEIQQWLAARAPERADLIPRQSATAPLPS